MISSRNRGDKMNDLLKLADELLSALDDLHGAYEKMTYFEGVLAALDRGERPAAMDDGWSALAARYDAIAASVERAPSVTAFDAAPYQTSLGEILDDATRNRALAKLRGFLNECREAESRGASQLRRLDDSENEVAATSDVLHQVIELSRRLLETFGGDPVFGELVAFQWFDLETVVRPALRRVRDAIRHQKANLRQEVERLRACIGNLAANIQSLETWSRSKTVDGRWVSTDPASRFMIELSGGSGIWTERRKDVALSRPVTASDDGTWLNISRPNDASVLDFLGFRPSVRDEILQRGPQPSFLLFRRDGAEIVANWYGLKAILTPQNHVERLVQPGTELNGQFRLRRT